MDTISILTARSKICTKRFTKDQDGVYVGLDQSIGYLFDHSSAPINSLSTLSELLLDLESRTDAYVIRGNLIEGRQQQAIRRTLKPRQGQEPFFETASRSWCMIDIDDLPLPEELSDYKNNKAKLVAHAVSKLPSQFQGVQCWYQFSSSMGIKKDKIRLHLWYWLNRPCSDAEMKGWLQDSPVDLALFNPVQPHFTANPIFLEGAIDPFPDRSGLYKPSDVSEVNVPELIPPVVRKVRSSINQFGQVDGQEIFRDKTTGLIINGRERFLLLCSNEATKQLVKGPKAKKADVDVRQLSDLTWKLFEAEADLKDGRYLKEKATFEARRRIEEIESGSFDFRGRTGNTILQPIAEPYFQLDPVSVDQGIQQLNEELDHFFENLDKAPKKALRITMGSGKTTQTIKKLKAFLATQSNFNVEIYVPRHDIADEYVDFLKEVDAQVIHILPRTGGADGLLPILCQRVDYVRSLEKQGSSVYQNACHRRDVGECEHFNSCKYIEQFDDPLLDRQSTNTVRIYVHNYLRLRRNPLQSDPNLVIIDESFFNIMVDVKEIATKAIKDQITSERHPNLGKEIIKALEAEEPLLEMLRGMNVRLRDLDDVLIQEPEMAFESTRDTAISGRSRSVTRALNDLIRVLQLELRLRDRQESQSILLNTNKDGHEVVRVCIKSELTFDANIPVLMLDATADPLLLQCFFDEEIDLKRIDIEQNAIVTQVYDRTGSNQFWRETSAPIKELISVLNTWADFGEKPLCVGNKSLIEDLKAHPDISPKVQFMNFVGLRGSNAAEQCSVVFITGRNEPPPTEIDHKARALFWDDPELLQHDELSENVNLPLELRGFLSSSRNVKARSGVEARTFSDARIEAVHQQLREAESIQAISRLRLIHNEHRKRVFILSNVPLEVPVDQLIKFDDLMPDRLEYEFLKAGNIPLTPLGLLKLRPDLATNEDAARMMLKRSDISDPERLKAIPSLQRKGLIIVEFKAKNNGRKREHQHLFILKEELLTDEKGVSIPATVSKVPIEDWIALLETSGWGVIEDTHFFYS